MRIAADAKIGNFRSASGFARFLNRYRACFADLPTVAEQADITTTFGTVRVYRFAAARSAGPPVLLIPGRNGPTPVYGTNLPPLLRHRDVYCLDLLGEPGLSVQHRRIADADDQAQWLDETLAGLGVARVHLCGISIGGWAAVNVAVRRPGRAVSLTLLDPAVTFDRIPAPMLLASVGMVVPGVPEFLRRRILSWIAGGSDLGEAAPVAKLIDSATTDFEMRLPAPTRFSDAQLSGLDIPVLALIAGRSVVLRADKAAARARRLLRRGQVELWPQASHAINGEYPEEIAARAHRFWTEVDQLRS
ncbi:MAG: alpha/beta fold hydrolase [Mycobacterium sp.]